MAQIEASHEEFGYLLSNLRFISLPEVVSTGYDLTLLWFNNFLYILLELLKRYDKIVLAANQKFRLGVFLKLLPARVR